MWGETYASDPAPQVPGTQVEFEELTKAFLMLLSSTNSGRLNGYITNHLLAKQHVDDRAIKLADESAASALALAKAQEKERAKLTKATPDFPEHVMLTYITKVEEKEGHLILPPFLNNSRVTTWFFDRLRTNNVPSSPTLAPDQCKPYTDTVTGQVLFYKTSAKLTQATDGDSHRRQWRMSLRRNSSRVQVPKRSISSPRLLRVLTRRLQTRSAGL
jgi:hypothetical protein